MFNHKKYLYITYIKFNQQCIIQETLAGVAQQRVFEHSKKSWDQKGHLNTFMNCYETCSRNVTIPNARFKTFTKPVL